MPFTTSSVLTLNLSLMRHYLRNSQATSGAEVLQDAFAGREVGAQELINLCLQLRANRRTRRSVQAAQREYNRVTGPHAGEPYRWYKVLVKHVYGLFRQFHRLAFPIGTHHHDQPLTQRLSRSIRRVLGYSGVVRVNLPTLAEQATQATQALRQAMVGQDVVLWVDNWYWERFTTNPVNPVASQNVTVFGVLLLSSTEEGPLAGTRSHRLPAFPGHLSLHHLTLRPANAAHQLSQSTGKLISTVRKLAAQQLQGGSIRVPLDISRPSRPSLQWHSLTLSQLRVSSNPELVQVLEDVRKFQQHVQRPTWLLVDEKIHYSVCRLLYSKSFE